MEEVETNAPEVLQFSPHATTSGRQQTQQSLAEVGGVLHIRFYQTHATRVPLPASLAPALEELSTRTARHLAIRRLFRDGAAACSTTERSTGASGRQTTD